MDIPAAVEHRRPYRETPAEKLLRELGAFGAALARTLTLTALFAPLLIAAFLTVDLPLRDFDVLFDVAVLKPSHWLSDGGVLMACALPLILLVARRYGGDEASATVTAAWGVAAILSFAGVSLIAPSIDAADLPSIRFVIAFVASAMVGQYLAISVYDVTRGGGRWWRAPLLSCLIGFAAQSLIYFAVRFWRTPAPWFSWMLLDLIGKTLIAVAFLPIYRLLLKSLRPRGGYGGR